MKKQNIKRLDSDITEVRGLTMKFVDAHIHFSDAKYSEHTDELAAEAKSSNVVALVSNSMDFESSVGSLKLAEKYSGMVYAALGIHPWNVRTLKENELQQTLELISTHKQSEAVVAIGEIGLDFRYGKMYDKQLEVFKEILSLAEKLELPIIVHSYCAATQIVEMLPSYSIKKVLMHWFSHPMSALSKAVENGYLISEGPPLVYSKGLREVVRRVPLTNFLTETDGPVVYKKPPFNGKMTMPSFLHEVVNAVAEIKKMDAADVAEQVARNFQQFFNVKLS